MNFSKELIKKAQILFDLASKNNLKIITAESCTGGLLSTLITSISGSSKIFEGGFVAYSNNFKEQFLAVNPNVLEKFGAVSEEVAMEMAFGALKNSDADISLAITGIAGPKSDDSLKKVGLVFIASFHKKNQKLLLRKFEFDGNRDEIRNLAVENAVSILIEQINNA